MIWFFYDMFCDDGDDDDNDDNDDDKYIIFGAANPSIEHQT